MYKEAVVNTPLFETKVRIIYTDNLNKVSKKYWNEESASFVGGVTYNMPDKDMVLMAFKNPVCRRLVVHECVHACNIIFLKKGIMLDYENDETQAYLTDWLYNECERYLNKWSNE